MPLGLGRGVGPILTLNQAAVSCLVIPAQAGTQGGGAQSARLGSRLRGNDERTPLTRGGESAGRSVWNSQWHGIAFTRLPRGTGGQAFTPPEVSPAT
jgi:hypothetical protein